MSVIHQPASWRNTIAAPVEEGLVELALQTIAGLTDEHFIPSAQQVQLLLYLVITPRPTPHLTVSGNRLPPKQKSASSWIAPAAKAEPTVPPAIDILHSFLCYPPHALLKCVPALSHPRAPTPSWKHWDPTGRLERDVKRRMEACVEGGVWALVWAPSSKSVKSSARHGIKRANEDDSVSGDDEVGVSGDEGDGREERTVPDSGWDLLSWLVDLWTAESRVDSHSRSPSLLLQLPRPYNSTLPHDDATEPLALFRYAFTLSTPVSTSSFDSYPNIQARFVSSALISLLVDAATPPAAPFHQPSLVLAFISLFRTVPAPVLTNMIAALTERIPWTALAHILMHTIEDLAGVRTKRNIQRQRKKGGSSQSSRGKGGVESGWTPPTVDELLDLVLLPAQDHLALPQMTVVKNQTLSLLLVHVPQDAAWSCVDDEYISAVREPSVQTVLRLAQHYSNP